MPILFTIVPLFIAVVVLFMVGRAVVRYVRLRGLWRHGVEADATCLRAFISHTSTGSGNDRSVTSTQHHVYEFRTREGQMARFEETGGPATSVVGDTVTIRYQADRPERATATKPGDIRQLGGVAFTAVVGAIAIAIAYFVWSTADSFDV